MRVFKIAISLSLILLTYVVFGQEIPPIQVFTPQDYNAEDQNWSITQSENKFIYAANNQGLLEFNGAGWKLYDSPNGAILRSVKVVGDKIYSGGYMDFGYWLPNQFNTLEYVSLVVKNKVEVKEDEEFWSIIETQGYILFQSFERIYIFNIEDNTYKIIESDLRINKMFKVDETIYFHTVDKGIYKIENGKEVLVIPSEEFANSEVINIFKDNRGLLLLTKDKSIFNFNDNKIEKWQIPADKLLKDRSIYSAIRLKDGSFMLGTISNGVIQLNRQGNVVLEINQSRGISNNTVLAMFQDVSGNVWLGLDNGINVININSPYTVYSDKQGVLGTVYASEKFGEYLYLGTNQGLFYKSLTLNDQFKFIQGTEGQVWDLEVIDSTLFCGHDKGTFIINGAKSDLISDIKGTWTLKTIEGQPDLMIQGNYRGLYILEKINNRWQLRNKIEGFDISSRYLEFISPYKLLVSHEHKGVYKIAIDSLYQSVIDYNKLAIPYSIKSSMVKYDDSILYCYEDGVFEYNNSKDEFIKDTLLTRYVARENYLSGKLIYEKENNRLWAFAKNRMIYVEPGRLSTDPNINTIAVPFELRKNKAGYENLLHLENNNYIIGTTSGYFILNLNKLEEEKHHILINSVTASSIVEGPIPLKTSGSTELSNTNNALEFSYSVPVYDNFIKTLYQHRLEGIYDTWSDWSSRSSVSFENLPHGMYRFEARAMTSGVLTDNVLSYTFTIAKPWYLKPIAILLYVICGLSMGFLVHYFNRRYYKRQKQLLLTKKERELELEQLENQRQLMQFKNKNLQLDIENKNRELGMATMNLVKRNELLNNIKTELIKSKSKEQIKEVVKLINTNLNNTSDWKLFEEAFNNVDKDFMKRVKALHPSITPNDLRLCAYLRLNLTSKEIAPLLNISHKSVEVKRYRLRKKMGLDHDQSLSDYIIEL
ncbi:triple tyrosine motif-containing protein [Winogradskyella aurantia]|uniref:LuxR family transcriptional regulator n=1 Tax=Winogradskyella aurantia TaxID=1915063 RepID=A0A265UPU1_9FLAO|nr:triple tyrosine motif-containing protein [Winogradskyella aurantia]OZV67222.1 LuxR family transcriptional regulator [Winogradskyella aurantia]